MDNPEHAGAKFVNAPERSRGREVSRIWLRPVGQGDRPFNPFPANLPLGDGRFGMD